MVGFPLPDVPRLVDLQLGLEERILERPAAQPAQEERHACRSAGVGLGREPRPLLDGLGGRVALAFLGLVGESGSHSSIEIS
jgi:hypothetical protein